ncbi:unnamed protein product [Taenia asiatica]|uniref:Integrase catalytic domain-containing protein n=1 Tax=Taenia asiatica TaxID=60517 RepID=A0A0R3WFY7_TAEAS|nr:unnamed protein product [Taenia asiatica]
MTNESLTLDERQYQRQPTYLIGPTDSGKWSAEYSRQSMGGVFALDGVWYFCEIMGIFKQLAVEKTLGIAKTRTIPGHPQGYGQVERTDRTLVGLLKALTKAAKPEDWDLSLGRALLAYRATAHASTGVSPFIMLTGREMRVPSDIFLPSKETTPDNVPDYVLRLKEGIRRTFNLARRHLQTSYSGRQTQDSCGRERARVFSSGAGDSSPVDLDVSSTCFSLNKAMPRKSRPSSSKVSFYEAENCSLMTTSMYARANAQRAASSVEPQAGAAGFVEWKVSATTKLLMSLIAPEMEGTNTDGSASAPFGEAMNIAARFVGVTSRV